MHGVHIPAWKEGAAHVCVCSRGCRGRWNGTSLAPEQLGRWWPLICVAAADVGATCAFTAGSHDLQWGRGRHVGVNSVQYGSTGCTSSRAARCHWQGCPPLTACCCPGTFHPRPPPPPRSSHSPSAVGSIEQPAHWDDALSHCVLAADGGAPTDITTAAGDQGAAGGAAGGVGGQAVAAVAGGAAAGVGGRLGGGGSHNQEQRQQRGGQQQPKSAGERGAHVKRGDRVRGQGVHERGAGCVVEGWREVLFPAAECSGGLVMVRCARGALK